jgi:hypothetical protein
MQAGRLYRSSALFLASMQIRLQPKQRARSSYDGNHSSEFPTRLISLLEIFDIVDPTSKRLLMESFFPKQMGHF